MDEKAKKIINRLDQLIEIKEPRLSVYQDIIDLILPGLESIFQEKRIGKRQGKNRYDGTGVSALQLFADGHYGYLVSPSLDWLRFRMRRRELGEIREIRIWLQNLEEHYYGVFNQTNFYESMSTYFEYAGAFGFADMYSEEDLKEGKIVFNVYHPGEIYLAENQYGKVDTVYRKCKIEIRKAIDMFGKAKFTETMLKTASDSPYQKYEFVQATYPNDEFDSTKLASKFKQVASVWVMIDADNKDHSKIMREKGYDINPHHVWRYKKGITPYGQGPAEDALIEVMGANIISKDLLGVANLAAKPAYNVPSELEGEVDVRPDGMNYYSEKGKIITPVHTGNNFPVSFEERQRIQQMVEKHFKVQFFILLASQEGTTKTATEIIELQGEKAAVLARPITRLFTECLNPIIDRVWDIESAAGRIPELPPMLEDYIGENWDPEFVGPLAQAQKKLFEVQSIAHGLESLGGMAQLFPNVLDIVDEDETARDMLRAHNFPQKDIKDRDKVKKIRDARAQAIAQENAQEDMAQMAEMAGTMAKADKASGGKMSKAIEEGMPV